MGLATIPPGTGLRESPELGSRVVRPIRGEVSNYGLGTGTTTGYYLLWYIGIDRLTGDEI